MGGRRGDTRAICPALISVPGPSLAAAQAQIDRKGWNATEFFRVATVADVKRGPREGDDPNATDLPHFTPLHWAGALNEDPAVVEVLFEVGVDPHTGRRDGATNPVSLGNRVIACFRSDLSLAVSDARSTVSTFEPG